MKADMSGSATPSPQKTVPTCGSTKAGTLISKPFTSSSHYGKADALQYISGLVPKVHNRTPLLTERGASEEPPQDMYFKGALMIATLRSALAADGIADDARWFKLIQDFYQHFKYQTILTGDVVQWWNQATGRDLTPFFNQYLRHAEIPALELNFDEANGLVIVQMAGRRTRIRASHPGRRPRALDDPPPHAAVAMDEDAAHPRPVPGSNRTLLRQRKQKLTSTTSESRAPFIAVSSR